jgi:hypothetical protein
MAGSCICNWCNWAHASALANAAKMATTLTNTIMVEMGIDRLPVQVWT